MPSRWLEWMENLPLAEDRPVIGYAFAMVVCVTALLLRLAATSYLPIGYPFVAFFPVVILTAFLFGTRAGLFAGAIAWVMARWFFIAPLQELGFDRGVWAAFLFYVFVILVDIGIIHMAQRANRLLRIQREMTLRRTELREAMFRELQHRVSNKLQIIASLLTLQKRHIADPTAQKALEDSAIRVGLIGRISRALYDPDRGGLGIVPFLEQVGHDIIDASGAPNVRLTVEAEPGIEFINDAGVPIALIVAETISNALEHGFQSGGNGQIDIRVERGDGGQYLRIIVADDGRGVEQDFDATSSNSLGLRIATTLARQLNGTYSLRPGTSGAIARLDVEALSIAPAVM